MAIQIQTILFLSFVVFYNCVADSPTSFINPPEESVLTTNVLTSSLDGQPILPTLHVFKEEHGKLVEEAVKDMVPAEENNNAVSNEDINKVISIEKNGDSNKVEGENDNKNQEFNVQRTKVLTDITSNEIKINNQTTDINAVKEVVDKTATDMTLTVNSGISGELIKEDVVSKSEAKPTLMATENVNTDINNNAAEFGKSPINNTNHTEVQSISTVHKEDSTSEHRRNRAFQPTHKYSRPPVHNKSSLKYYLRNHVTTTAKPVHFVPSVRRYNARTYKHTATTSKYHHSYHSQNSKIKSDSDTSETTESSVDETTPTIQHTTLRGYRNNHRFAPNHPSSFSRLNSKLVDHISTDNATSNNETFHTPESNEKQSNSAGNSHYRSPGYRYRPHSYQNQHPSSTQTPELTKTAVMSSNENVENDDNIITTTTTTTTKVPIRKYHRYVYNKHPLSLSNKLVITTAPTTTTTTPTVSKDSNNKDITDVKPTMSTYERFRLHQKTVFNRNTQIAKNKTQEEIKSEIKSNQKEKSNDEDDKGVDVETTTNVYQRFRHNRPRMSLMPKKETPVKNLENTDDKSDIHQSKSVITEEDSSGEPTTTSIYQRFRANRPRMNFKPKIEAQAKNLGNSDSQANNGSANEHTTTNIYQRFRTNRPQMIIKSKIQEQVLNKQQSNSPNNENSGVEEPTTSSYRRFRSNSPHINLKPKIEEEVNSENNEDNSSSDQPKNIENDNVSEHTTSIYQRFRANRPRMNFKPKIEAQVKHLENHEEKSASKQSNNNNNEDDDANEHPTTSIYQRFRPNRNYMMKPKTNNSGTTNNKNKSEVDVPTTTSVYQKFRQRSPHMHLKTQSIKSQTENHGEVDMGSNDEDDSSTVPPTRNIYQRYRQHSPHMHLKTPQSENLDEVNVGSNNEDDSSTQFPTTKNIYQRYRQHSPHMHVKTPSSNSQSENVEEVNLETNDKDDSSTQVPTTKSTYQRYRQHSPHMHLKTPQSENLEVNVGSNDEGDSSTQVPTTKNIYHRFGQHRPHMHLKTPSTNSQLDKVHMESNDENDSSTQVPTTTNIYQRFRQSRPHMHIKSTQELQANEKETTLQRDDHQGQIPKNGETDTPSKTSIYKRYGGNRPVILMRPKLQTPGKNLNDEKSEDLDSKSSEEEDLTHSSLIQNEKAHGPGTQGSRYYRRNLKHHSTNPNTSDDSDGIYDDDNDDDDEDVNDFNTHSSYRPRRPYGMRHRPSLQNDDSEEVEIEPENKRRVNRFQRRFASPANLENSNLESRSLRLDDSGGRLLKRKSRENSSYNKTFRTEGQNEATRSDKNTPEQTESLNLFSTTEDDDDSLFETYDPGEEYSFFDIQDDFSSTDKPVEKVTVTLPKSFIEEEKTNKTDDTTLKNNKSKGETQVDNNEATGLANPAEIDHMQEYIDKRKDILLHEPEIVTVDPNHWFEVGTDGNKKENEEIEKYEEENGNVRTETLNLNVSTTNEKDKEGKIGKNLEAERNNQDTKNITDNTNKSNANNTNAGEIKSGSKDKSGNTMNNEVTNKENTTTNNHIDKDNKIEETVLNNENISKVSNTSNEKNINKVKVAGEKHKSENSTKGNEKLKEIKLDKIKETDNINKTKEIEDVKKESEHATIENGTDTTNEKSVGKNKNTEKNKIDTTTDSDLHKTNKTGEAITNRFSEDSNKSKEDNVNIKDTGDVKKQKIENTTIDLDKVKQINPDIDSTDTTNEELVKIVKITSINTPITESYIKDEDKKTEASLSNEELHLNSSTNKIKTNETTENNEKEIIGNESTVTFKDKNKESETNKINTSNDETPKKNITQSIDEKISQNTENSIEDEGSVIKNVSTNNNTGNVGDVFSSEKGKVTFKEDNSTNTTTGVDTIEDLDEVEVSKSDDSENNSFDINPTENVSVESNIYKVPPRSTTPKTDTTIENSDNNYESTEATKQNKQNVDNNLFVDDNSTDFFVDDDDNSETIKTVTTTKKISDEMKEAISKSTETFNESEESNEDYSVESNIYKVPPRSTTPKTDTSIKNNDNNYENTEATTQNVDNDLFIDDNSTDIFVDDDDNSETIKTVTTTKKISEEMKEDATTQNVTNNLFIDDNSTDIFEDDDDNSETTKTVTTTNKMSDEMKEAISKSTETFNESEESNEDYSAESNIYKVPPRSTTSRAEIEIKENEIVDSNWPVIAGKILGKKAKFSVEINIKNDTIYIPSDVTINEDLKNLNLSFSWSSSKDTKYKMSLNLTKNKSKYYEIDGVEVYRWKDGNASVWVKNITIQPKKDETADTLLIIEVENDVKVMFSNVEFLEVSDDDSQGIRSEASEASEASKKLRMFHAEIAIGVLVIVFFFCIIMWIVISKLRLRSLKEENKVPTS